MAASQMAALPHWCGALSKSAVLVERHGVLRELLQNRNQPLRPSAARFTAEQYFGEGVAIPIETPRLPFAPEWVFCVESGI